MANEKTKLIQWLTALNDPKLKPIIKKLQESSIQIPSELEAGIIAAMVTNAVPSAVYPNKNLEETQKLYKALSRSLHKNDSLAELENFFYTLYQLKPSAVQGDSMKNVIKNSSTQNKTRQTRKK